MNLQGLRDTHRRLLYTERLETISTKCLTAWGQAICEPNKVSKSSMSFSPAKSAKEIRGTSVFTLILLEEIPSTAALNFSRYKELTELSISAAEPVADLPPGLESLGFLPRQMTLAAKALGLRNLH